MTVMCVAKSSLNISTAGNPLIINRSSHSRMCMCPHKNAHTHTKLAEDGDKTLDRVQLEQEHDQFIS